MGRAGRLLIAAALAVAVGGWTQPQQLETGRVASAAIQGDGHGHRVAAWSTDPGLRVAVADKGRDFGPPQMMSTGDHVGFFRLVVNAHGDALVAWQIEVPGPPIPETTETCCTVVRAALVTRDGRITRPVTLSDSSIDSYEDVGVAAGSRGRFYVVWSLTAQTTRYGRVASVRRGFGPLERVRGLGRISSITADRTRFRVQGRSESRELQETARSPGGRWSKPVSLLGRRRVMDAAFAADARGRQVAIWVPQGSPVRLGTRKPPGPLERALPFPIGAFPGLPVVARSGAAVVVSTRPVAHETGGRRLIDEELHVTMRRPGGRFRPFELVYRSSSLNGAVGPAVAPDGAVAIGVTEGEYPSYESRVVLVRPGGGVRSADLVAPGTDRRLQSVVADSHGAAALLTDRDVHSGLWAVRSH